MRPLGDCKDFVFPSPLDGKRKLSDMAMLMALRRVGYGDQTRCMGSGPACRPGRERARATTSTPLKQHWHTGTKMVVRAYNHTVEYWNERRVLAEEWARRFCSTSPTGSKAAPATRGDNVVSMQRAMRARQRAET